MSASRKFASPRQSCQPTSSIDIAADEIERDIACNVVVHQRGAGDQGLVEHGSRTNLDDFAVGEFEMTFSNEIRATASNILVSFSLNPRTRAGRTYVLFVGAMRRVRRKTMSKE